LVLIAPHMLYASAESVSIEKSDFIERTINFVIFIAIVWYFGADKIKGIFTSRIHSISTQLKDIQESLNKAKKDEDVALMRLEECKRRAKDMLESARQEALLVQKRYNEQVEKDAQILSNLLEGSIEFERRRITQEAVNSILCELLEQDDIKLNRDDYVNIITKRIS